MKRDIILITLSVIATVATLYTVQLWASVSGIATQVNQDHAVLGQVVNFLNQATATPQAPKK